MQPLAAQAEDIEAVLSRFQTWTGSRKNKDDQEGIREISYEEALRSSRYRWKARTDEPSATEPPAVSSLDAGPHAGLEAIPVVAPEISPPAQAVMENEAASEIRPRKIALSSTDFRAVLARTLPAAETSLVRSRAGEPERQVSMSLRLAASEQALVKLRAAEAGLSASAYLRQCALEVEHLRAQMQILLEISQAPRKIPSPQQPRFVEKLRGLFSRTKKKADYTAETSSAGWLHRRELAG